MPPNTFRVHMEYELVKSVDPKILWVVADETTSAGDWRIFPSPPVPCLNCGGGVRWCRHLSQRSPTYLRGSGYIHSFPSGILPSSRLWCSRLRTTTCVHLAPYHDELRGLRSDYFRQTILEAKREKFVDDALIYAKSLCEQLEISFEPSRRIRRKHIFGDGSKDVQLSYENDLRRTMFSSIDRITAEIRERFQQLQNLAQKYAFLRPEVILNMDELT
ncbi:uncharacterized protein TNCV_3147781 [Trichonephila clavipes]|nr:uncharacterized protein TNCV_3147781 [Trichonephila clavipes]